jgi:hypothetical protein
MIWIEFHPEEIIVKKKFYDLRVSMGWSVGECLGYLGLFWGRALKVREDGDVTGWAGGYVSELLGFGVRTSEKFLESLKLNQWIDKPNDQGRELIHDWLNYTARFLRGKYSKDKAKLFEIWKLHGRVYGEDHTHPDNRQVTDIKPTPTLPIPIPKVLKEKIYKKEKFGSMQFLKPTADEVKAYAASINFSLSGDKFVDYYESKGWKIGKNSMKDWKAAVRTWKSNQTEDNYAPTQTQRIVGTAGYQPGKYD